MITDWSGSTRMTSRRVTATIEVANRVERLERGAGCVAWHRVKGDPRSVLTPRVNATKLSRYEKWPPNVDVVTRSLAYTEYVPGTGWVIAVVIGNFGEAMPSVQSHARWALRSITAP